MTAAPAGRTAEPLTMRLAIDSAATFDGSQDMDDADSLVTFASGEDQGFLVVYIQAGDWVRMGRPAEVTVDVRAV